MNNSEPYQRDPGRYGENEYRRELIYALATYTWMTVSQIEARLYEGRLSKRHRQTLETLVRINSVEYRDSNGEPEYRLIRKS